MCMHVRYGAEPLSDVHVHWYFHLHNSQLMRWGQAICVACHQRKHFLSQSAAGGIKRVDSVQDSALKIITFMCTCTHPCYCRSVLRRKQMCCTSSQIEQQDWHTLVHACGLHVKATWHVTLGHKSTTIICQVFLVIQPWAKPYNPTYFLLCVVPSAVACSLSHWIKPRTP